MFIGSEELRIKWKSSPAELIINKKETDEEEVFNYLCSLISKDAIYEYTREIKSRIVMPKAALENKTFHCKYWRRKM
jgi:hypothetical protein